MSTPLTERNKEKVKVAKIHLSGPKRTSPDKPGIYYKTLCQEFRNSDKHYNRDPEKVDCENCLDIIGMQRQLFLHFLQERERGSHAHEMASATIRRFMADSLEPKKKLDPVFEDALPSDDQRRIVEVHHHYYGGPSE